MSKRRKTSRRLRKPGAFRLTPAKLEAQRKRSVEKLFKDMERSICEPPPERLEDHPFFNQA